MFKSVQLISEARVFLISLFLIGACMAPIIGNAAFKKPPKTLIKVSDQDGDGRISAEEWQSKGFNPKKFKEADGDGDGYLTLQELTTYNKGGSSAPAKPSGKKVIPILNGHVHINHKENIAAGAKKMIAAMDKHGIAAAIIMSPPSQSRDSSIMNSLLDAAGKYPGRLAVMGGGSLLNPILYDARSSSKVSEETRKKFTETAEKILEKGAVGFGEMTALHLGFRKNIHFMEVPPDHPLFLLLADIAARHDVPIDLHMEAIIEDTTLPEEIRDMGSYNPSEVSGNIAGLKRLLAHNSGARIIWSHAGGDGARQRSPALIARLLAEHQNLYVSFRIFLDSEFPVIVMGKGINPEWLKVIMKFPDRFFIGTDGFHTADNNKFKIPPPDYRPSVALIRNLPEEIGQKVAYENVQRIFKLDLIKP